MKRTPVYPLTILADRYGGTYSGAVFTAWNKDADLIPEGVDAGDVECDQFWQAFRGPVGKGETPDSAMWDLVRKLPTRRFGPEAGEGSL